MLPLLDFGCKKKILWNCSKSLVLNPLALESEYCVNSSFPSSLVIEEVRTVMSGQSVRITPFKDGSEERNSELANFLRARGGRVVT